MQIPRNYPSSSESDYLKPHSVIYIFNNLPRWFLSTLKFKEHPNKLLITLKCSQFTVQTHGANAGLLRGHEVQAHKKRNFSLNTPN